MMNMMSPLQWAQLALDKPELVAEYMASQGKAPPPPESVATILQSIPAMGEEPWGQAHGSTAKPNYPAAPGMGEVPTPPPLGSPMVQGHGSTAQPDLAGTLPAMGDVPSPPVQTPPIDQGGRPVPEAQAAVPTAFGPFGMPMPQAAEPEISEGIKKGQPPQQGVKGKALQPPAAAPVQQVPVPVPVPVPVAAAPAGAPGAQGLSPMPAPTAIAAMPVSPAAAGTPGSGAPPVTTTAAPGAAATPPASSPALDALASAMAGIQASGAGGGGSTPRAPQAPAPYQAGALNPQTAAILKAAIDQALAAGGTPSLNAIMGR